MDVEDAVRDNSEFEFHVAKPVPVATGTGICSDRNFSTRTRTCDQNPWKTRGYSRTRAFHYMSPTVTALLLPLSPSTTWILYIIINVVVAATCSMQV